jgi:hypothetical protein
MVPKRRATAQSKSISGDPLAVNERHELGRIPGAPSYLSPDTTVHGTAPPCCAREGSISRNLATFCMQGRLNVSHRRGYSRRASRSPLRDPYIPGRCQSATARPSASPNTFYRGERRLQINTPRRALDENFGPSSGQSIPPAAAQRRSLGHSGDVVTLRLWVVLVAFVVQNGVGW